MWLNFIALLNVEDLKEACASSLVFTERKGEGRRKRGREGVVVSCNKFNLNPKLTRCHDCRVLKI